MSETSYYQIPVFRQPGARFSKVPKSFRARKATTKISNLKFTELFFSHVFNMNKFSLHAKFHTYTLLCFENSDNWKWLRRPETYSGLSRNGPLDSKRSRLRGVWTLPWAVCQPLFQEEERGACERGSCDISLAPTDEPPWRQQIAFAEIESSAKLYKLN